MFHDLVRLFRRWNERVRANPSKFRDPRFGSVKDVAEEQARTLIELAKEDDMRIVFEEHGDGRRAAERRRFTGTAGTDVPPPAPPVGTDDE